MIRHLADSKRNRETTLRRWQGDSHLSIYRYRYSRTDNAINHTPFHTFNHSTYSLQVSILGEYSCLLFNFNNALSETQLLLNHQCFFFSASVPV
jgi:hypothetical protein